MTDFEKFLVAFVGTIVFFPVLFILAIYVFALAFFEPLVWLILVFALVYYLATKDDKSPKPEKETKVEKNPEFVEPKPEKHTASTYIVYAHGNMTPKAVANFNGKPELKQVILPDGRKFNVLNQDLADFLASNPGDGLIINTVTIEVPEN